MACRQRRRIDLEDLEVRPFKESIPCRPPQGMWSRNDGSWKKYVKPEYDYKRQCHYAYEAVRVRAAKKLYRQQRAADARERKKWLSIIKATEHQKRPGFVFVITKIQQYAYSGEDVYGTLGTYSTLGEANDEACKAWASHAPQDKVHRQPPIKRCEEGCVFWSSYDKGSCSTIVVQVDKVAVETEKDKQHQDLNLPVEQEDVTSGVIDKVDSEVSGA